MAIDPPNASQTALAKLAGDREEPLVRVEAIHQASSGTSTVPDQGGSLCGCIDLSDLRVASRIDEASTPKAEQLEMLAPLDVRRTLWRTCSHLLSAGLIRGIDEVAAGSRMGSPPREAHPGIGFDEQLLRPLNRKGQPRHHHRSRIAEISPGLCSSGM